MAFMATLTAALKAIPRIVDLFENLNGKLDRFLDARDDAKFEAYKKEVNTVIERMQHATSKEETAELIARLNPPK